ncbi:MAG: hypothetical protein JST54_35525 [Deltaproteobacteria bacterium]|nr:hypothetical protein [Deltaproteobacteria bacterium]
MADDIGKWVDEAKAERAKDEKRAADKKAAPPPHGKPPKSTPPDDERIEVYRALHPGSLWVELAVVIVVAAIVAGIALIFEAPPKIAIPIVAGLALVAVVIRLGTRTKKPSFAEFRRWRRELPFELVGWPELVDGNHFDAKPPTGDDEYWRSVRIDLDVDAASTGDAMEAIDAVLLLFCNQANSRFYELKALAGSSFDPRKKWQRNGLSVAGSTNFAVRTDIYSALLRRLEVVARARSSITRVVITVNHREERVKGVEYNPIPSDGW